MRRIGTLRLLTPQGPRLLLIAILKSLLISFIYSFLYKKGERAPLPLFCLCHYRQQPREKTRPVNALALEAMRLVTHLA